MHVDTVSHYFSLRSGDDVRIEYTMHYEIRKMFMFKNVKSICYVLDVDFIYDHVLGGSYIS